MSGLVTRAGGRKQLAVTAVAVLAIVAAGLLSVVAHKVSQRNAIREARTAAVSAAISETRAAMTYDYTTLARNVTAAERGLTPAFRSNYEKTIASSVQSLATKYHATTSATVLASGVSGVSPDSARVLLFVDAVSNNSQLKAPRLDRYRITVSMVRSGGRWLINDLQPF